MRPLFLRPPYLYVLFGVACLLALREPVARWLWRAETDRPIDRPSFGWLWGATSAGVVVAVGAALVGLARLPPVAFWVGIATMLAGFALRLWAMVALGSQFSHRVAVKPDHEVVETGPYRWVRHPAYTGAVVTYLGIGLVTGTAVGALAALAGALAGYGHRVRIEERALRERLPDYAAYAERTPSRLIPGVW